MLRSEKFYFKNLYKYLIDNYGEREDEIEWYPNPDINQWKFKLPGGELIVLLTCDDDGEVDEEMVLL